jgi:hypothetical protein
MDDFKNAPIALFTFKRPSHTRRTLESLSRNPQFTASPLYIYCDGARHDEDVEQVEATRKLVRDWPHPNKNIVERDENWGLANSVVEGVTQLCEQFGRVIVIEDDLVVSPFFLNYLNAALERYEDEPKVMQISGYMFPIKSEIERNSILLPVTSTWGWATWNRAWKNFGVSESVISNLLADAERRYAFDLDGSYPYVKRLTQQLNGKSDSWGIRWYLSVFCQDGLVVYPPNTLVQNIGHDGSGTHCKVELDQESIEFSPHINDAAFPEKIYTNERELSEVKKYLRIKNRIIFRGMAWLRTEIIKLISIGY